MDKLSVAVSEKVVADGWFLREIGVPLSRATAFEENIEALAEDEGA